MNEKIDGKLKMLQPEEERYFKHFYEYVHKFVFMIESPVRKKIKYF